MKNLPLWVSLAIMLIEIEAGATSSPQTVGSYNQFITSGSISADTSQSYGNASAVWNPNIFTINFPPTFVKVTSAQALISLQGITSYFPSDRSMQAYALTSNISSTSFVINVYSKMAQYIQSLVFRYLVIANYYFTTYPNLKLVSCVFPVNSDTSPTSVYNCAITPPLKSIPSDIYVIAYFNGVDFSA